MRVQVHQPNCALILIKANIYNSLQTLLQVSWVRHRDIHLLTVGRYTYTSDQRFRAIHHPHSDDWVLQIKYPQHRDSGIYECQVGGVLLNFITTHIFECKRLWCFYSFSSFARTKRAQPPSATCVEMKLTSLISLFILHVYRWCVGNFFCQLFPSD